MTKRGQAAMEFLMTYGWAILVVLIAIGALAYFGVLNPARFLPESCTITPGISCEDKLATQAGVVSLTLRNGMGVDLDTVSIEIYSPDTQSTLCTVPPAPAGDDTLSDGELETFTGTCTTGNRGSRFKADVAITYTPTNGAEHTKTGSMLVQIE